MFKDLEEALSVIEASNSNCCGVLNDDRDKVQAAVSYIRGGVPHTSGKQVVLDFANAILHGDEGHRDWLLRAAAEYSEGRPVPIEVPNNAAIGKLAKKEFTDGALWTDVDTDEGFIYYDTCWYLLARSVVHYRKITDDNRKVPVAIYSLGNASRLNEEGKVVAGGCLQGLWKLFSPAEKDCVITNKALCRGASTSITALYIPDCDSFVIDFHGAVFYLDTDGNYANDSDRIITVDDLWEVYRASKDALKLSVMMRLNKAIINRLNYINDPTRKDVTPASIEMLSGRAV